MFLVTGITGHIGGATALRLLERGHAVRALVRDEGAASDWADRGVDLRSGDLTDPDALAAALEGVDAAFLMQPTPFAVAPDFPEAKALIASFVAALARSTPPRLILLSSVGSEKASGLGNITQTHLLEAALGELPRDVAVVRPGSLLENYRQGFRQAASTGRFESFLQPVDRPFPMTATRDVGHEIARLMVEGWRGRLTVEIGARYSPAELAEAMAGVLGRPIEARAIPRAAWPDALRKMQVPEGKLGPWMEMQDGFNSGWIDFGVPGTAHVAGTTTPADYFCSVGRD